MRVYSTDNGWGLFKDESSEGRGQTHRYRRTYTWNSRNQLVSSVDANYSTSYVYGQDGQRSNKYTQGSETLYFNKMWTLHTDNGNSVYGGQYAKNVYLGETRIVTKLTRADQKTAHEEMYKQYYYHSDHLGSATMISDWEGKEYQRIEYTPYGETWVEKTSNSGSEFLPYKFTGKEVDQETGLYYYGARYLNPKYSMWISTDPALGEYVPEMGKGNSKNSANLPGMGGVYNHINFHLYHYAGNNPVKYVDPDGRKLRKLDEEQNNQVKSAVSSAVKNLNYIIKELTSAYNNSSELDPNILSAGRKYLHSSFGENKSDYIEIAFKLDLIKKGLLKLQKSNVFYQDSDKAYGAYIGKAFPSKLCCFIELTKSFFEEKSSGGWTNQEGILIHEVSHNLFTLHTNLYSEENYSAFDVRMYKPNKGFDSKQNNASNWEFFYYEIFDPKNN